tara:strand:- start:15 stop:272 length:258 start_codon:yes stop_codon:yes gene_type:complete
LKEQYGVAFLPSIFPKSKEAGGAKTNVLITIATIILWGLKADVPKIKGFRIYSRILNTSAAIIPEYNTDFKKPIFTRLLIYKSIS